MSNHDPYSDQQCGEHQENRGFSADIDYAREEK